MKTYILNIIYCITYTKAYPTIALWKTYFTNVMVYIQDVDREQCDVLRFTGTVSSHECHEYYREASGGTTCIFSANFRVTLCIFRIVG